MKATPFLLTLGFATAALAFQARACIWDSETLAMEVARLPEAAKILTGNFPRHSRAFHEWRVRTTSGKLKQAPHLIPLYDDLAVSQHKLGDHSAAIATMLEKEKRKPGIYETYSNLGTFYIYTGDLLTALKYIDKALALNANAHFGREKYQKWLVEYVIERKVEKEEAPGFSEGTIHGYAAYVLAQHQKTSTMPNMISSRNWVTSRLTEATKGVLGMMHFADYDNPLLQEALGDILMSGDFNQNASHLASQCYWIAVQKCLDEAAKKLLLRKFNGASGVAQWDERLAKMHITQELQKGTDLQSRIAKDEIQWIAEARDPSAMFISKYYK
jgi:tetratricopeptide (TPR) repeat protein